jgi:hypothetical protein
MFCLIKTGDKFDVQFTGRYDISKELAALELIDKVLYNICRFGINRLVVISELSFFE